VKVVCAWCRSEGREGLIGERPPLDDPRETSGVCWMHKLETLHRTRPSADRETARDGQVRFLVIVGRQAPDLFARVSDQFLDDPRVQVLTDRRRVERRRSASPHQPERRGHERRRAADYWEDIRRHPVVIVPTWKAKEIRPPVRVPQPTAVSEHEVKTMESTETVTQTWRQIETWIRDSQHMVSDVIPSLVQECDELRKQLDSAEAHVTRLKREVEGLQGEVTRMGKEVDRLTDERAAMTGVVERGMSEIARLAGEVLTALKER
jgi:archaellum component FlaC